MSEDLPKAAECIDTDSQLKSSGRNRICKQCKFSCTDSKEFFHHQMYAHSEESEASKSSLNRKNSFKTIVNIASTKRQLSRSNSTSEVLSLDMAALAVEKMNGHLEPSGVIDHDDEKEDEGRLVIAEDEQESELPTNLTPLRSGNIQNRTYMCNLCDFSTTSAKTFLHHQKDNHNLEFIIYECDICEYATKYKQKLPRHRKLHFTGKDSMPGSDLDNSFSETRETEEQIESSSINEFNDFIVPNDVTEPSITENEPEPEDEEPDEVEEEEDTSITKPEEGNETEVVVKKKKTRQEVDPSKYFEVFDDMGVKFACSKCGNVYKWRKSLNKHWKEKHFGDCPNHDNPPPGLTNYSLPTPLRNRSSFGKTFGNGTRSTSASPSTPSFVASHSRPQTPQSTLVTNSSLYKMPEDVVPMPKIIGPFITHSSQPVFPVTSTPLGPVAAMANAKAKMEMKNMTVDKNKREAFDFSKPSQPSLPSLDPHKFPAIQIKEEPHWDGETDNKLESVKDVDENALQSESPILQCSKCAFVAKTLVDYSSHMTLHLNKRAFKCAECQEHFNGVDDLNKHFSEFHADKISEHKEAIQKIPHGLQQTYHLLKMPLKNITSISSQELTSSEPKQLRCNMCSFVAKWPAELQKHAVSHSEERPFMCMVCGSTYKWKWDLVKHFEKSHHTLPNPYKRREQQAVKSGTPGTPATSPAPSLDSSHRMESSDQEPSLKKRRLSDTDLSRIGDESYHNNNSVYLNMAMYNEDGPDGKTSIAALESLARPSSEPMLHNDELSEQQYAEYKNQDLDSAIESSYCDGEMDDTSFASIYNGRPINSETQKAVINAVRQRMASGSASLSNPLDPSKTSWSDVLLPYKCPVCEYRARWPSEITQHMKNHSDEKPFHCPRCNYKSKWKWDVVKHMKRCGGGTIKDVIDTSKSRRIPPPNVTVMPQGNLQKQTPQPVAFLVGPFNPSKDDNKSNQLSSKFTDSSVDLSQMQGVFPMQTSGMDSSDVDVNQNSIMKSANTTDSIQELKHQISYNSIINQGQYHCMECSFMGTSPAELRRHSVMHSESKPFTCRVCGYSSRWKCDLKKHMRTYEHDLDHSSDSLSPVSVQDKFKLDKPIPADSAEQQHHLYEHTHNRTLYKCSKCPYVTYKKQSFTSHLRIHGDQIEEPKAPSKFKCKQCDFHADDLPSFLQHKIMHSNSQQSTLSNTSPAFHDNDIGEVSTRTIHLKHRRKPVKQFQCSKCPYVCFKKSGITLHEAMHEPRGTEAYTCMYCDYNVYSKSLLLQHMRLHSEYNPTECVEFIKIDGNGDMIDVEKDDGATEPLDMDEEEYIRREELQGVLYNQEAEPDRSDYLMERDIEIQNYMDGRLEDSNNQNEQSQDVIDLTEGALDLSSSNRSTESSNPPMAHTSVLFPSQSFPRPRPVLKLPCEWCDLQFPNITTLHRHSKNVHPIELRDQEIAEAMRADLTKSQFGNPKSQKVEIPPERYFLGHNSNKNASQPNQQKQLPQPIHSMLFGVQELRTQSSALTRTSTPILSTENQKSALQQFSRNMPQHIQRPTPVVRPVTKYQEIQPAPPKSVTNLTSSNLPANKPQMQPSQINAQSSLMQLVQKARKTTSPQKRSRSFQCTKCSFTAPNAVTYLRHIERHGSKCKHTCRYCDYSIDRLNLLYQHMKGTHGDLWKGTAEEKISMSTVPNGEEGGFNTSSSNLDTSNEGSFDAIDDLIETVNDEGSYQDARSFPMMDEPEDSEMRKLLLTPKGKRPVLIVKEETTWRGVPVQICTLDGRKNYKCPKCSYISSNAANTTNHVRQHGGSRKYICDQCDYSVDNLKLIYHHMETVHPPEPLFIEVDGTTMSEEMDSISETSEMNTDAEKGLQEIDIDDEGYFSCPRCPFRVKSGEVFQRHLEKHEYNGCHRCKYCDYSVDKYNILLQHELLHEQPQNSTMKNTSPRANKFVPSPSKREMNNQKGINAEFSTKTVPDVQSTSNKPHLSSDKIRFKCPQCPYNTFYQKNIIKHRKQHMVKNRFRCPHCNYSALREFLLRQHLKFHGISNQESNKGNNEKRKTDESVPSPVKNLTRNVDGEGHVEVLNSKSLSESVTPVTSHNDRRDQNKPGIDQLDREPQLQPKKCDECPYSSTSSSEFSEHCRLHGASYRYACDYCSYSEDQLNLLNQHRKLHYQEPDFDANPEPDIFLNENFIEGLAQHENFSENIEKEDLSSPGGQVDESIKDKQLLLESLKLGMKSELKSVNDVSAESIGLKPASIEPSPACMSGNEDMVEDEKLRYSCSICPYRCNALKSYKCHIAMHETPRKYICDFCNWSADRLNLLYQHRKVHIKEPAFKSTPGELVFLNREFVMDNEPISSDSNNNAATLMNGSVQDMRVGNHSSPSQKRSYSCKLCPFVSNSKIILAQHRNCHRIHARYTCDQCSFSVDRWNPLAQHMKLHKTGIDVGSPNSSSRPRFHCKKCPYHSSNRNLLNLHETMHASGRKHTCTYCDYSIDRFNLLQQHMRVHTQYSQNKAGPGKSSVSSKPELKALESNFDGPQLYFESQEDPENGDSDEGIVSEFKCERCPYGTSSKEDFDDHELNHNVRNKHTCPYCDYSCQEKNQLIPHVQVHFPGTPMNVGSIKHLVTHPSKLSGKESDVNVPNKPNMLKDKPASEPDSTMVENNKTVTDKNVAETNAKKQTDNKVEMEKLKKTKIYVCQYCEREFEGKTTMLQHEKQHLIGAQY